MQVLNPEWSREWFENACESSKRETKVSEVTFDLTLSLPRGSPLTTKFPESHFFPSPLPYRPRETLERGMRMRVEL